MIMEKSNQFNKETKWMIYFKNFGLSLFISWFFIFIGLIVIVSLLSLGLLLKNSHTLSSVNFICILFIATLSMLLAYSGVHRVNISINDVLSRREIIYVMYKKIPYIFIYLLAVVLLFFVNYFIQNFFSKFVIIPFIGPYLLTLFSIPFFLLNFIVLIFAALSFIFVPLLVGEGEQPLDSLKKFINLFKQKSFYLILFAILSIILLVLCSFVVIIISLLAVTSTKFGQWNVNIGYPSIVNKYALSWGLPNILQWIIPKTNTYEIIDLISTYGKDAILQYRNILQYIIMGSYLLISSVVIAIPIVIYSTVASNFYKYLKKISSIE